jgi:hypothetical protein
MDNNVEEFVLYEDESRNEERIENSTSDIEMISDEEYLLECARFGEYAELVPFLKSTHIDINYKDERGNNALRKSFLIKISHLLMDI